MSSKQHNTKATEFLCVRNGDLRVRNGGLCVNIGGLCVNIGVFVCKFWGNKKGIKFPFE